MKRISRKCPNNPDHTMHRAFISQVQGDKRTWTATAWQYCPSCKIMMPD